MANFWLGAGGAQTASNALAFIDSTLHQLGCKMVGLFDADSSFFDEAIPSLLEGGKIDYIISARLTHTLQAAIVHEARWWVLETGLELAEIANQSQRWAAPRRVVVVRQSIKRKTRSLCADDPDLSGWRHGAMVTLLTLPDVKVWRSYRERADGENRIAELKADVGLDSFALNDFRATDSALGFAMPACAPKDVLLGPPDEAIPASCQANQGTACAGHPAWSGAGHRHKLAPQSRLQYVDSLLPGTTTGMVHGRVEQCGSSTSNSFGCVDSSNG